MSQFLGMDVNAVRQLAQRMNQDASEIRKLVQQLTSMLHSTQWTGPDQQRFLHEWEGTHVKNLNHVAQELEEAARAANKNAQEQESASNS